MRAKKEAEEKKKKEAELQAKKEAEEKAKKETVLRAKREAEEKRKKEAELQAKKEAEEKAENKTSSNNYTSQSIANSSAISPSTCQPHRHFISTALAKGTHFLKSMVSNLPLPSLPHRKRDAPSESNDTRQTKKQRISDISKDSIAKKTLSFETNSRIISTAAFAVVTWLAAK